MSSALVTIENLNKSYGRGPVLQSLNLTVNSGRIVGVMGPNGCGKTTLFKILTGLISDYQGTVTIDGRRRACIPSPSFPICPRKPI